MTKTNDKPIGFEAPRAEAVKAVAEWMAAGMVGTRCALCGKPLASVEEVRAAKFVGGEEDYLAHRACYENQGGK